MNCQRPECNARATHIWEGEVLCYGHAVDKREALLTAIMKEYNDRVSSTWRAFYNSRKAEGEVDQPSKQV